MATPVYLRDLTAEQTRAWLDEITVKPVLLAAYEAGDDIVVGYYLPHPLTLEGAINATL